MSGCYAAGNLAYQRAQHFIKPGPTVWLSLQEAVFRLYCYGRRYALARKVYGAVTNSRWLRGVPARRQERWLVKQAYLHYLSLFGVKDPTVSKSFRLGKFLNGLPDLSQQKEGSNITVVIIRILFLIYGGEHRAAGEQIDRTGKYLTRYLRGR